MELLKERIRQDGLVIDEHVLKVDQFLNHQMDIALINEIGKEFRRIFKDHDITKIITIEASGIGIACIAAQYFNNVPVIFAKKSKSINIEGDVYWVDVKSYTHKQEYNVILSKKFLNENDTVLLIDDFLANGCALSGLIEIVREAKAKLVGAGIVIEKTFQEGGKTIRNMDVRVESLVKVKSLKGNVVEFDD